MARLVRATAALFVFPAASARAGIVTPNSHWARHRLLRWRRGWYLLAERCEALFGIGKELLIGRAQVVHVPIRVVVAHQWTSVVTDMAPTTGLTRWIAPPLALAEGNGLGAGSHVFEFRLVEVAKEEFVLHIKVAGVDITIVLDDYIVTAFHLELAYLGTVAGIGQEKVIKEPD
jgi:hypothetical protein